MVVYVTKISEKMKNQYINYRKKYYRMLKTLYYNHKKLLFKKKKDLESFFDEEYKGVLKN